MVGIKERRWLADRQITIEIALPPPTIYASPLYLLALKDRLGALEIARLRCIFKQRWSHGSTGRPA